MWGQLQLLARNLSKSRDEVRAAVGRELASYLQEIEESDKTVSIGFEETSLYGGAYTRAGSGEDASIHIDPTRVSGRYDVPNQLILVHELGHAATAIRGQGGAGSNTAFAEAIRVENVYRSAFGCRVRRSHSSVPRC